MKKKEKNSKSFIRMKEIVEKYENIEEAKKKNRCTIEIYHISIAGNC